MIKANTVITAGELLTLAKIPNWEKRLGKEAAKISGIRGITMADRLIKICEEGEVDVVLGADSGVVEVKGVEEEVTRTDAAKEVRKVQKEVVEKPVEEKE